MESELDEIFNIKTLFTRSSKLNPFLLFEYIQLSKDSLKLLCIIENAIETSIDPISFNNFIQEREIKLLKEVEETTDVKIMIQNMNTHKLWKDKVRNYRTPVDQDTCLIYTICHKMNISQE